MRTMLERRRLNGAAHLAVDTDQKDGSEGSKIKTLNGIMFSWYFIDKFNEKLLELIKSLGNV